MAWFVSYEYRTWNLIGGRRREGSWVTTDIILQGQEHPLLWMENLKREHRKREESGAVYWCEYRMLFFQEIPEAVAEKLLTG